LIFRVVFAVIRCIRQKRQYSCGRRK